MADPTELERILKARGIKQKPVSPPTPPPKPVSKSELELLLESRGIKPRPVPKNEPEQKPARQVSGAGPKRDFLERLAADNMPDAPPSPYVSSAPYYLARPTGDTSTNFVPVLDETLLRDEPRKIETRYDPMGMPYDVDAEDPSRPINDTSLEAVADAPFGERPLSVPQALGLSDRSTSVRPTRDAFTPFDLPEDLNGQELLEIALDPNMDSNLRRKAQYALSRLAPKSLQSLPEDKQPHTASPFVNDIETELKNLRVDPLWLVSGDKAARDEPAKMLADLNALYRKRLIRTAPGKNYTSDLDVPKEELAAINAKASEMAENKYKEIADGVGGFNLVRMKDAQTHIDNARKNAADFIGAPGGEKEGKGTLFAPFFAALSPGVYTVNDVYSTQQGHPVVRREGMGAFSMRAPTSTAIGSWLFNPESTWEFGGEHGWGGEQHMRDITYGYQLGDSMEHMRDVTREAFQSGLSPGGANMMAHVLVDIPTLGVMMVEPDMYALPGLATFGMAKLARPVVTGVNTASDILKELRVLESAIEATTTGDELDALLRASVSEPISTKSTAARSVYAEAQNYIADTASDVPLSEMNPLHNVTNATLRKLKAGDIDEPGEFIPTEAKQIGQQHAEVDRAADMSGARADELDTAYQVMHSQAMLDGMNVRAVIDDIDRLAGNNDVQTLRAEMDTARLAADIAAADLANLARFNMARMGVENIDMPGMIRTGNFRQVLAQLYRNRGELFSILRKAGEGFDKLDPAKQAARIADLQAKVAAAKRTLIDNVGDIAVARKVAEYAAAQDTIAAKAAEIGKRLKEHAKAAGKGTARVTPDQVAEARKAIGRQQKTWERLDDLALRQQIARKVHTVTTEMYKPLMLKAVRKHIDAVERFIANGGPAKQKEVGSPIYASVVNDLDEIDVDKYIDELQTRLGKDVVESTISSPIGKILDELAGMANKSGPLVKLSGSDYDRLQLFEDAVHAENFRVEKLGPQARAEVMLNTVKEWKDLGGKAWVNVFRGKESLSTPLFQLYHRLTRRFDAAGGSDVGHMSARLQEHVRRTLDRGRAVLGEIDDVGLGAKLVAPTDGGTQLTGLDAIEEFITTKRRYGGAIWNQGDLTIHQRGFLYLRSILDTDFAADNVIVFAIAGAPAKSFDPVVMSVIGDAIRSLKSAIKSASNADEAMVLARQAVRNAMLRQKGATDSDEVVRHIVARAFAYAAVQYDSALDFQRLFGPGISSESARVLNWMMSPATSNLALGSADAAFNTAAHLGLPLKGDMRGEWRRAFGVLADSRAVSTELVKRAQVEGYGLFVPAAVRTALHEENLKIAKEMTEFSRNNKNSMGSLLLRLVDHIRFQGIFGWLPHAWLPFGNLFGGASWLMLEKGGAQRAGQFVFSNAPAMVPWVGLRGPGGSPGLHQIAYDTAAAHSIATRVFDPKVAKFLFKGDLDEVIALPTGERTTIGRLLREAEEDGADTFLNSDEMRHIIREQRKLREGSPKPGTKPGEPVGPASVPDGPPDASGIPGARLPLDPMDAPVMAKYEETVTAPDVAAGSPPVRAPETIVPPTPAPGAMDSVPPTTEPSLPDWMMNPDPIRELGEAETPPPWTLDMPPVARAANTAPPGGPGQPSVPPGWLNPPPAAAKAATPGAPPPRMPPAPPTPPTPPTPPSPAPGAPGSPGPGGTHSPLNVAKRAANALGMFIKGPWTEDFARWVENLESRARLSYYVGLRLEGNSRMATRERLHRNLGNWSTGLSNSEAQFWGRYFSVYRWTRIKMRHMGETLAWSLTKPDVVNPRDIVFNNTPLGRLTRLGKLRNNIPNLFDWDDSTDKLSDDEQFDAWGRRTLPWWEHSGVWLGARPALDWEKRMKTLSGREVSFVEMQLISLQALDELYLLNAFAQAAIATTIELSPLETNYAGIGTGDDAGLAHALSRAAIDEFSRNIDKKWAEATRDMLNAAAGNDNPENFRGILVPRDQHVAVKTIARINPAIVDYGFIQEDPNGELRADSRFWPALELMVLQLPMIDDLARATAHGVNVYNDPSLAHSLGLIVGDYTSLYREVGFDPTKDHDYAVRERVAQLKEALIRADRDANSNDDRDRKRSGQ